MKKIISLLMAVIFVFSMATPTFAAVSANEAAQVNAVSVNDASSTNDIFGDIVDTLNRVINSIINFFKNLFGLNDEVGEYKITYYQDDSKTVVLYEDKCAEGAEIGTVKVPTLPGKTFKGWKPPLPSEMPAEDIEVYATWSDKTYTLVFNTGAIGVDVKSIDALYNSKVTLPTPTVDNYQLLKWEDSNGNRYNPGATITVTSDMSFIAVWSGKITTITFDPAGGYWADGSYGNYNITKPVGTAVEQPANPTRPGYDFIGWNGVVPQKQPVDNITFTAKWSAKTIKTTWVVDGVVKDTQTGKCGDDLSPNVIVTADKGYTFSGWKSSYDNTVYAVSDFPIATPAENTTFTAVFTANEYSYKFVDTDGTTLASGIAKCGASLKAPVIANATGCTFGGWKLSTNGLTVNDAYVTMPASNVTFTVIQTPNTYNIVWDVDGVKTTTPAAYGSEIVKPADPKKAGYVFNGWAGYTAGMTVPVDGITFTATWANSTDTKYVVEIYKMDTTGAYVKDSALTETKYGTTGAAVATGHADIEGFTFNESKSVLSGTIAADGSTALKVYYDRNKYTVTVNGTAQEYYYGATIKAPAAATQEGCTFAGWRGSDGKLYAAGADVTVPANDSFTLTPEFTPNNYTITFNVNGAEYQKLTFAYGADIIAPADPTMADMYFEGWSPALPTTMPANNLIVTAVFSAVTTHKVTFHANKKGVFETKDKDGKVVETTETTSFNVKRGDSIPCPDAPKASSGNRFIGWATYNENGYTEKDVLFTGIEDSIKMSFNQDIFFYAVYVNPTCDVTYIVDGVELTDKAETVALGSKVDPSKVVPEEKTGYAFSGWKIQSINGKAVERDADGKLINLAAKFTDAGSWTVEDADVSIVYVGENVAREHDVVFNAGIGHWFKVDADGKVTEEKENVKTVKTKYDTLIEVPSDPVAPYGKIFLGWTADTETNKIATIGTLTDTKEEYSEDKIYNYYAVYAVDVYELQFVEYNQTVTFEKKFGYGDSVDVSSYLAKIPEREGHAVNEETPFYPAVPSVINNDTIAEYGKNVGYSISYKSATYTDSYGTIHNYEIGVLTFKVQYDVLKYKVFFSGCDYETMEILYGTLLSEKIADPTAEGRTFEYWYVFDDEGKEVEIDLAATKMPAAEDGITLYAKWSNNPYTIKFVDTDGTALYDQDGKVIPQINGLYGDAVTAPKAPIKTGYIFAGWDIEIPATILAKDMVIKATWTPIAYTVSFNTNGGQPEKIESITQDFGTQVKLPANPTKTGHTFLGWDYVDGNAQFVDKSATTMDMTACDVTLTARWQINQYTITFETGYGSPINAITADYGTPIKVSTEWAGHTYTWVPALPETMPDKDMTVTADWECVDSAHTVYFHPVDTADDPETAKDESYAIAVTYDCKENGGAPVTVPTEADFAAIGYKVATGKKIGSWKNAAGSSVGFSDPLLLKSNGSHYYVKEYVWADYTLTFNTDGGSDVASATYKYNDAIAAPAEPTKAGYTFAGWYNSKGNLVDFETAKMPASDTTFTAKWTVNKYVAKWDNEGTVTEVEYDFGAVINLPAEPTRYGYTFGGWTNYTAGMTMPVDGITFYAVWNAIPHKATFDPNGGAFNDPDVTGTQPFTKTINYGTAINAPKLADRTGYTFSGWVDKDSLQPMPDNMPNKDVTFYAVWVGVDGIEYTVNTYTMDTEGNYGAPETVTYTGVTGETADYSDTKAPEGFTVAGKSNLTGIIRADGSLVINIYFERNQYTFTTVVDGKKTEEERYYGTALEVPTLPEKTADTVYTGWSWAYTLDGKTYNTKPETMPACDVTATVTTTPRLYTVSFMSAGSSFTPKQYEYNTVIDLSTLGTPSVTGKQFLHWSMTDGGSAITTLKVTDNVKIYAVWKALTYTASFYDETGTTLLHTASIAYGTSITYTPPARDGYTFDGWVIEGETSETETMPAKDVKLLARWTATV